MKTGQRLLLAFVVGPLATFPVTMGVVALWWSVEFAEKESIGGLGSTLGVGALIGLLALLFAYPIMLVIGVPVSLVLRKLDLFQPREMKLVGGLAGALPFLPMTRSALHQGSYEGVLSNALMYLVAGILSGAVSAWLVWRISSGGSRSLPASPTERKGEAPHAHGSL